MKVTQTIKNTSLAIEKWPKQIKTPPSLHKSDVNSLKNLAHLKKVTQTIKNTSLSILKWRTQYKTHLLLYKSVLNNSKHVAAL